MEQVETIPVEPDLRFDFGCDDWARVLERAVDELDARERLIVQRRDLSATPTIYKELGRELGVGVERCRQLHCRAYRKLRDKLSPIRRQAHVMGVA